MSEKKLLTLRQLAKNLNSVLSTETDKLQNIDEKDADYLYFAIRTRLSRNEEKIKFHLPEEVMYGQPYDDLFKVFVLNSGDKWLPYQMMLHPEHLSYTYSTLLDKSHRGTFEDKFDIWSGLFEFFKNKSSRDDKVQSWIDRMNNHLGDEDDDISSSVEDEKESVVLNSDIFGEVIEMMNRNEFTTMEKIYLILANFFYVCYGPGVDLNGPSGLLHIFNQC